KGEGTDGVGTVTVGGVPGFTLPAGKTITIRFRVTVDTGVLPAFTTVSNQGTVSGSNFADVLTDDSDVVGVNQPTVTNIDHTTVAVSSNANPSVFGQNVTFTATMTGVPARASDPPGTVQFKADGNNIGAAVPVVIGAAGDNVSTAQASISSLSVGSHVITAQYSGGGAGATGYNANIGTLAVNQVVNKANTASAILTDTPDPSLTGQSVTVTFTVTPTGLGAGTPTGNVTVSDGVDQCTATAAVGTCTLALSTAGVRNLTATYVGDGNFNASPASPAATHTVTTTATWVGGTSSDWDTDANWGTGRKPNLASHSANIPAAGVTNEPTISVADVTLTDLTVATGRTLTVNVGRILTATGNTTLSGNLAGGGTSNLNNLAINNAAGVAIGGNANVSGVLTLTSGNTTVAGTLSVGGGGSITRTAGHIIGNLKKTFAAPGSFTYHVGTANGYSPLATTVTAGTGDLTVKANEGTAPPLPAATTLQRYWTLTEAGNLTANLTFNYLQTDVMGNEAVYRIIRVEGGLPVSLPNNCPSPCVNPATNTAVINGVMNFSDWTLGEQLAPTAAEADISGQVVFVGGRPMRGVTVSLLNLTSSEVFVTRTDAKGRYRFEGVATGTDYLISVTKEGYSFNPPSLLFTHTNAVAGVNFEASISTPVGDDGIQKLIKEGAIQGDKPVPSDLKPPGKP
ncbi:MAG: Ig-like domain repeat protein, partial [Pyrinomonadaceae bacterium]|nr:Ig-like domain repeat protein [Pyrinomonadaceae bacterium]